MKIKSLVLLILLTLTTVLGACQGAKEAEEPKNVPTTVESPQKDEDSDKDGENRQKDDDNDQNKDDDDDDN
ncbi:MULTISPECIES: neurohypophysial hormones like protein [unclassified Microcystis]|uniref:Neurohypophysial hormones like protein n=1 Tax=Microcystis aeruginosa Ma_QC_Ca_00000000_S207 TaxID=2486251 RepID=A0A552FBP3_MICAE|nr:MULTISPECIES: neurohypophysial hormones like protein [unclassified Microcystis]MCA2928484.1 neurohypophysial hormones like protein [Microcystis sp. M020S1]MCA2936656.1 neurohypophysial hormones like protein [Microcystis sp. M015S1]TRU44148.1 MAG: neurohypophysial hormones like protein [Microcystis aeruginosa Ma_QC_Ca_00000000_S207]MCA2621958.1 neurohypophysial hormones like protein [Microcystis sp. M099S2]MCA2652562.1 neurohypophysial hormones like protein [Microcystis sp. M065S2]